MITSYLNLNKILDLKKWQNLQDSLALVTKLAIITVDYKGVPITVHSAPRPFCKYVRSDPDLAKSCQKCDSRGGLEAVRMNAPYIYLCHCNIVDIAIPIIIDDKYVGAVMAGEVKLPDNEENTQLEQILVTPAKELLHAFKKGDIKRMYDSIPTLSYAEIVNVGQMLFSLCHYIVEEAMNKNLILEMYEKVFPLKESPAPSGLYSGYSLDNIEQIKKEMANAVTNAYLKTSIEDRYLGKDSTLKPAFHYIFKNKGENISQKKMADLCHISTGYFSRLFVKETGKNFSAFIARQKIEWSKQLLEKTDLPISQISDELGFSEPGYYIKTFKKFEGITPLLYRKYYKDDPRQAGASN